MAKGSIDNNMFNTRHTHATGSPLRFPRRALNAGTSLFNIFIVIISIFAVIGFFTATRLVLKLKKPQAVAAPLAEPAKAPYADSIGARGIIESVDENVRVAPSVAGVVTALKVKVGDRIETGDLLIELDSREAQARIETLQAAVAEAEVLLADQTDRWKRIEKLAATSVATVEERQSVFFTQKSAEVRLLRAKAELQAARIQMELLSIRAPRSGTVLQVNVREGEWAAPSQADPVILLGQIDHLQLRADVDEDNATRIRPGQAAVAYIKGTREHPINLRFVRIEPYIVPKRSLSGESTERVDTRVLQVIYQFDQQQSPVYVGQQMDVFIDAGEATNPPR